MASYKHGLATGLHILDIDVLAVRLDLGLRARLGGVGLHEGKTIIAVNLVAAGGMIHAGSFSQILKGGGKTG